MAKITGKEGTSFEGKARVFNSEEEGVEAILNKSIEAGDVVVIRYEGPKGGPGMREMLKPTSAIMGQGLGDKVGFITDGRFSGGTHGFVVGHITPEAADGGVIAIVEDGDTILIDAEKDELILKVSSEEIEKRLACVDFMIGDESLSSNLKSELRKVPDLDRSLSRIALDRAGPRDLVAIRTGLRQSLIVSKTLAKPDIPELIREKSSIFPEQTKLLELDRKSTRLNSSHSSVSRMPSSA